MHVIRISNSGNLGNRMFQYLFYRMIQFRVPNCKLVGYDMPEWDLVSRLPGEFSPTDLTMKLESGHIFDIDSIVSFLKGGESTILEFGGYAQRLEYYSTADLMSSFFHVPNYLRRDSDDHSILINIRSNEILSGTLHGDYLPIPISFYESLIKETKLAPIFLGRFRQIGKQMSLGGAYIAPYSLNIRVPLMTSPAFFICKKYCN